MKTFPFIILSLLLPLFAQAETPRSNYISNETQESPRGTLLLGFASYDDSTQQYIFNDPTKKNYEGTQEAFLGYKLSSGWSLYGVMKAYAESYNGQSTQTFHWVSGDSSITVGHPLLYKSYNFEVGGQFRTYIGMSPYTVQNAISPFAYYSTMTYKPGGRVEIVNTFIPRYYYEANYTPGDTNTYFEDRTTWTKTENNWFAYGLGQWAQLENHSKTTSGYCVEVYPYANFKLSPGVTVGPRVYFPLSANGSVYEGPTSAALDNIRAEVFVGATL
jgi:hypothetical protein